MSTNTYTYTRYLSSDFPNGIISEQLHVQIDNDSAIAPKLVGINTSGDAVDLVFDAPLSSGEVTELNRLIKIYIPVVEEVYQHTIITNINVTTNQDVFTRVGAIIFPGAVKCRIKVHTATDSNVPSHCIKIYDRTNNNLIATNQFTNKNPAINDIGTVSNIPHNPASFEIVAKKGGGLKSDNVYVFSIQIDYS